MMLYNIQYILLLEAWVDKMRETIVLESLRYKYTSRRVLQRERMTSSLAFLSNSVRQATSSQREKLVLQVKTKREGLSQLYTIKSSFSIINC